MNTNRLIQVIRWNLIADKRKAVRDTIGGFIAIVFSALIFTGFIWHWQPVNPLQVMTISSCMLFAFGLCMLYYASTICQDRKTKTSFINYAMLPATKLEKFWARWAYATITPLCCIIIDLVAGDLVQMLFTFIVTGTANSYTLQVLSILWDSLFMQGSETFSFGHAVAALLALLYFHSTFILGGCFFRKHPMLLTCVAHVVVTIGFSMLVGTIITMIPGNFEFNLDEYMSEGVFAAICDIILIVLIVFIYWLSFCIFSRQQIINNKFFN